MSAALLPSHLPWKTYGTSICFANVAGGFDVRNCPDPDNLAAFITLACNTHPALLSLAERYASECAECGGTGELSDESADVAKLYPCDACADIRQVIATAKGGRT